MGMYTLLIVDIELQLGIPTEVLNTLRCMVGESPGGHAPKGMEDTRWYRMLLCSSAYFDNPPRAELTTGRYGHRLNSCSSFKNYDDEIEKFITWISPYCTDSFGQYVLHQYETAAEPTLVVMGQRT